jgi:hypothetical protein
MRVKRPVKRGMLGNDPRSNGDAGRSAKHLREECEGHAETMKSRYDWRLRSIKELRPWRKRLAQGRRPKKQSKRQS